MEDIQDIETTVVLSTEALANTQIFSMHLL